MDESSEGTASSNEDVTVRVSHVSHDFNKRNSDAHQADSAADDARKRDAPQAEQTEPPALSDVSLTLRRGELVIMTGPSGSGKTTLLTLIGGLRTVQAGSLTVLGRELHELKKDRNRNQKLVELRRNIGFIFQAHNLFDSLTARQNVSMALELNARLPKAKARERATELLDKLFSSPEEQQDRVHDKKPGNLSGGQKQRVAIARALANKPPLILADEPTAALDSKSRDNVAVLLREVAVPGGATVVIVTHDYNLLDIADRIVNLRDGKIVSNVQRPRPESIKKIVEKVPLFENLTVPKLFEVYYHMTSEEFEAGQNIVCEGEKGDKMFLITAGTADVFQEGKGKLATLKAGEAFGEMALEHDKPRNATVKATSKLETLSLRREDYDRAKAGSPEFAEALKKVADARRRAASASLSEGADRVDA